MRVERAVGFHAILPVSISYAPVPDKTTHCRFRNPLVKGGVHDDLLGFSDRGLQSDRGSRAEAVESTATLVQSTAPARQPY